MQQRREGNRTEIIRRAWRATVGRSLTDHLAQDWPGLRMADGRPPRLAGGMVQPVGATVSTRTAMPVRPVLSPADVFALADAVPPALPGDDSRRRLREPALRR